jgi:hypothetical protein
VGYPLENPDMSHGFSRFGPPSARDRFHQQTRPAGTLAMLLPTILATLFMFTVVITLNKASSLTRGGKIVRLMSVDDVFPTQLDVEQNRKKEFWELTPPPPSPDWVLMGMTVAPLQVPVLEEPITNQPAPAPMPVVQPRSVAPEPRTTSIPTPEIKLPAAAPDTSLPVVPSTP